MIAWMTAALAAPVTADELVTRVLTHDPDVASAEAVLEAARGAHAASRGLRANPTFDGILQLGVPQAEIGVSQSVSVSGEGLAAAAAAGARVDEALARLQRARAEGAARARILLAEAITAEAEVSLARAALERATKLRVAIEAQSAAGAAPEVDARLARLAEAAAVGAWLSAARQRDELRVELGERTGSAEPLELPTDPMVVVPAASAAAPRSDVAAAERAVDASRAELRRERSAVLPPLELGVRAGWENIDTQPGPDGVVVAPWDPSTNVANRVGPTANWTVPLWHRNDAGRAEARAGLQLAEATAESARASAAIEARTASARRADLDTVLAGLPALSATDGTTAAVDIERAYVEGALSGLEAATWLDRIGLAERALLAATRERAVAAVELALAEEWATLIPD